MGSTELHLTEAELQAIRDSRNFHDENYKALSVVGAPPPTVTGWWDRRQFHKTQSKILTGILVKAYQEISNEIGEGSDG